MNASCVALPPTSDIACIVVGGETSRIGRDLARETFSSNVYALNRKLTEWTLLGTIRKGRSNHIALPIS